MKKLKKICAWCPDKEEQEQKAIKEWFWLTHGMCEKCAKQWE
jgi:hypothetical protein